MSKNTPNAPVEGASQSKIVWPTDPNGVCKGLRRELLRSIGRVQGDPAKEKLLKDTIKAAMEYGNVRIQEQKDARKAALEKAKARAKAEAEAAEKARLEEVARKEDEVRKLVSELEAEGSSIKEEFAPAEK